MKQLRRDLRPMLAKLSDDGAKVQACLIKMERYMRDNREGLAAMLAAEKLPVRPRTPIRAGYRVGRSNWHFDERGEYVRHDYRGTAVQDRYKDDFGIEWVYVQWDGAKNARKAMTRYLRRMRGRAAVWSGKGRKRAEA